MKNTESHRKSRDKSTNKTKQWGKDFVSIFQRYYNEITVFHAAHDDVFFVVCVLFQQTAFK